jgi:hypothetical protein
MKSKLFRVLVWVLVPLSGALGADPSPGSEVTLRRDATLTFRNQPYDTGKVGQRFKVLDYRASEKRVYVLAKDRTGKDIALAVEADAVVASPSAAVESSSLNLPSDSPINRLAPELKRRFVLGIEATRRHVSAGTNGGLDYWSAISGIPIPKNPEGTVITSPTRDGVRFLSWKLGLEFARGEKQRERKPEMSVIEDILLGGALEGLIDSDAKRFLAALPEKEREAVGQSEFVRGVKEGRELRIAGVLDSTLTPSQMGGVTVADSSAFEPSTDETARESAPFPFSIKTVRDEISAATHQPFVEGDTSVIFQFSESRKFFDRRIFVASKAGDSMRFTFFLNGDVVATAVMAAVLKSPLFTAAESEEFLDLVDHIPTRPKSKIGRFEVNASLSDYDHGKMIVFKMGVPK